MGTHALFGQVAQADIVNLPTDLAAKADGPATTSALAGKQPLDPDLTAMAALDSATAGAMVTDGSGWFRKTYAQLKTALGLVAGDITSGVFGIGQIPTGTTSTTVPLGNDARFTDSRAPNGTAGGSLAGSYPNPTIAAGAITGTEIAAAVKDPVAGTAGLRTLGTGAAQAAAGNDSRLSDSRAPNGTAGGVLNGTYPNPGLDLVTSPPYAHGTTTGTVTVDPTLGNNVNVGALTGNIILTPSTTGALDGQMLFVVVRGHASSTFTITNTGPTLTTGLTSPFSLAGGKYAFLGYRYVSALGAWVLLAYTASL